ncbi:tigger transposable element-derived protein 1 [Trichonephila inaurata madagascariensis]|uniref:Tigger transposable element-derived protein 1 n=1 Tax=Trichonephila inaurata madagascariensis TaxID=2747483 RepID=A0A8X6X7U6_9ARAC|nr:tigger transposable element-derived protein 1 [Trichonephila inaurata madagascariensis]
MPKGTFLSCEEKETSGFKAAKDRLTLLLDGSTSGGFKLKPLLVYHSKNPRVMKGISKSTLPITKRSLKGVWKNIWPDLSKGEDIGHSVDMDEIVKLAKQTGLDEVNVEDIEEIVQETAASLSNDELKELTEQEENKNIDSSDFEEEQKGVCKKEFDHYN